MVEAAGVEPVCLHIIHYKFNLLIIAWDTCGILGLKNTPPKHTPSLPVLAS